jgi:hypothetical protein
MLETPKSKEELAMAEQPVGLGKPRGATWELLQEPCPIIEKAMDNIAKDAMLHGQGFMKDGKRISHEEIFKSAGELRMDKYLAWAPHMPECASRHGNDEICDCGLLELRTPVRESGDLPVHEWKNTPEVKTTPVKCLLCDAEAVVITYAPHGCTCSPNKIQPRCAQHLHRARDTMEEIYIIEDFIIGNSNDVEDGANSK